MDNGYLDEAVNDLLKAEAPAERAVAARTLGVIGSRLATAHLIAALFDSSPEVCRAAAEALTRIDDPAVAVAPLNAILTAELDQKTPPVNEAVATVCDENQFTDSLISESVTADVLSPEDQVTLLCTDEVSEKEQLSAEQIASRQVLTELESQLLKTEADYDQVQEQVMLAVAKETRCARQAASLSREVHEFQVLADEAGNRKAKLEAKLKITQEVRQETEGMAQRLATEKQRLRTETDRLSSTAAKLEQERVEVEARRRKTTAAAARTTATRARKEAEAQHQAQLDLLRQAEAEHRQAITELDARRQEVEAARQAVIAQTQQLAEQHQLLAVDDEACRLENERIRCLAEEQRRQGQEQLRQLEEALRSEREAVADRQAAIETARRAAECEARQLEELLQTAEEDKRQMVAERQRLEAEAGERAATEKRQLENIRLRVQEEKERLDEVARQAAKEQDRLAELEAARIRMELESSQRKAREKELRRDLERLTQAETEQELRLLETEAQLVTAQSYREGQNNRIGEAKNRIAVAGLIEPQIPNNGKTQLMRGAEVWLSGQARSLPTAAVSKVSVGSAQGLIPINGNSAKFADTTVRGLDSLDPQIRASALAELGHSGSSDAFGVIVGFFDDVSPDVRNAAARALYELEPNRRVESFTRAIEESAPDRCKSIGRALVASGLATEAIDDLNSDNREDTYNALCLLFVMAKTGEVQPLVRAVEKHSNVDVRRAAIKLLTLNGHSEIAAAAVKHRLMMQN